MNILLPYYCHKHKDPVTGNIKVLKYCVKQFQLKLKEQTRTAQINKYKNYRMKTDVKCKNQSYAFVNCVLQLKNY